MDPQAAKKNGKRISIGERPAKAVMLILLRIVCSQRYLGLALLL
jgi:hypothetical protein